MANKKLQATKKSIQSTKSKRVDRKFISVFEMLKIGIGPSSSHTLGPWRSAERFIKTIKKDWGLERVVSIKIHLYGSLSLTGKGHATDVAIMLGLNGADPETIPVKDIDPIIHSIQSNKKILLNQTHSINFYPSEDIVFNRSFLEFHPNGLTFIAKDTDGRELKETYFSVGGGFIIKEGEKEGQSNALNVESLPYSYCNGEELLQLCKNENKSISEIVRTNENFLNSPELVEKKLRCIWETILECVYIGCHTEGYLPGGLNVRRRAYDVHKNLMQKYLPQAKYKNQYEWLDLLRNMRLDFRETLKWVDCFAMSVNEVNAALGRIVTAPTNGSAGVIPAVLMYYLAIANPKGTLQHANQFLLISGAVGSIFKRYATISAAMGGCQAEIGVSSAMAAAALTELMNGSPAHCLMAAEIAMEHHLGMTCDPIKGLVQIPCIERNSMGTVKAINACELALSSDPSKARVSLDMVVATMWQTAQDMNKKYKETSEAGLAVNVSLANC